jgi:hypothetical protein
LPDFLHLPLDGHHFGSKKKIPSKENTGVYTGSEEFAPHMACLIMLLLFSKFESNRDTHFPLPFAFVMTNLPSLDHTFGFIASWYIADN